MMLSCHLCRLLALADLAPPHDGSLLQLLLAQLQSLPLVVSSLVHCALQAINLGRLLHRGQVHRLGALQQNQSSVNWRRQSLRRHCGCGLLHGAQGAWAGGPAAESVQHQMEALVVEQALWLWGALWGPAGTGWRPCSRSTSVPEEGIHRSGGIVGLRFAPQGEWEQAGCPASNGNCRWWARALCRQRVRQNLHNVEVAVLRAGVSTG